MNIGDKIIYAHKGFFDAESEKIYRENSAEVCGLANTKKYIKIIEVDLRKSKDGILYCYHGNLLEYYIALKFRSNLSFLKKRYRVDTFKDILEVISPDKVLILDIKDHSVSKEDILKVMGGKKFREVILGNRSVSYLERFADMPSEFVKLLNGNICSVLYNLQKLKKDNFKYIEIVFPFLATKKVLQKIKNNGLIFIGFPAVCFVSREQYIKTIDAYHITYVANMVVQEV